MELRDSLTPLLAERTVTIYVDVVASGVHFEENRITQGNADILLERWTLQIQSDWLVLPSPLLEPIYLLSLYNIPAHVLLLAPRYLVHPYH